MSILAKNRSKSKIQWNVGNILTNFWMNSVKMPQRDLPITSQSRFSRSDNFLPAEFAVSGTSGSKLTGFCGLCVAAKFMLAASDWRIALCTGVLTGEVSLEVCCEDKDCSSFWLCWSSFLGAGSKLEIQVLEFTAPEAEPELDWGQKNNMRKSAFELRLFWSLKTTIMDRSFAVWEKMITVKNMRWAKIRKIRLTEMNENSDTKSWNTYCSKGNVYILWVLDDWFSNLVINQHGERSMDYGPCQFCKDWIKSKMKRSFGKWISNKS